MQENEQKKSLIKQKILQFIDIIGITKYKFYKQTGITRGVLDQKTGLSEENIAKFLACYKDINPDWLILGKGEMLKPNNQNINSKGNAISVNANNNKIGNNNEFSLKQNDEIYLHRMLEGKDVVIAELRDKIEKLQQEFLAKVESMDKRNQEIVHNSYLRNKENQEQINRLLLQIEKLTDKLIKYGFEPK
ncbi:MAG: hypothetical protein LBR17_01300 [Bacteroidales bacterium]|jgi:hypothetical protein|nr:hypothetical protein [Bacteroidales bacterium]